LASKNPGKQVNKSFVCRFFSKKAASFWRTARARVIYVCMKPYGIAANLSDAVALTAAFGPGAKIGIGTAQDCDILAPGGLVLSLAEARAALALRAARYVFTFGNTGSADLAVVGPVIDLLATASGTGFVAACLATPWDGRGVYQGHLFDRGSLQSDLKRDLAGYIEGRIGIVTHATVAAGAQAVRGRLVAMKEQGVRLALVDAIDDDHCGTIAEALAPQPVIAGPAWISSRSAPGHAPAAPVGAVAILSGALDRQTLMQTAIARTAMPVLDLDLSRHADAVSGAVAWARPHFAAAFMITSSAPPDKIGDGAVAAEMLAAIAAALAGAGIRNFMLVGNDTAALVLTRLGITGLVAGASFAGLRWLQAGAINILIKPGGYGAKNLFLYEFEPQSRLNEPAE
jgi:uncharacterized protein YgbK (DUF1537 family)